MVEKIKTSDLCTNCINLDTCGYWQNQDKPIIYCEEFSCSEPHELQIHEIQTNEIANDPDKINQAGL